VRFRLYFPLRGGEGGKGRWTSSGGGGKKKEKKKRCWKKTSFFPERTQKGKRGKKKRGGEGKAVKRVTKKKEKPYCYAKKIPLEERGKGDEGQHC